MQAICGVHFGCANEPMEMVLAVPRSTWLELPGDWNIGVFDLKTFSHGVVGDDDGFWQCHSFLPRVPALTGDVISAEPLRVI